MEGTKEVSVFFKGSLRFVWDLQSGGEGGLPRSPRATRLLVIPTYVVTKKGHLSIGLLFKILVGSITPTISISAKKVVRVS